MADSMSRQERQRHTAAVWFAVHEKDLQFDLADEFADWWTRVGFMFHWEIRDGFLNWQTRYFPEAVGMTRSSSSLQSRRSARRVDPIAKLSAADAVVTAGSIRNTAVALSRRGIRRRRRRKPFALVQSR
jgi:hypothetical protein